MVHTSVNHIKGVRPNIKLTIQRVEASTWDMFKKHHYLTEDINKSCKCFIFRWNGEIVGFVGILNTPRKGCPNAVAISRVVVLPDFQGMGIGYQICCKISAIFKGEGYLVYIKTVNDSLGKAFGRHDKDWRPTSYNGKLRKETEFESGKYNNRLVRISYCYAYEGEPINGLGYLLAPIADMRKQKTNKKTNSLF